MEKVKYEYIRPSELAKVNVDAVYGTSRGYDFGSDKAVGIDAIHSNDS
tara:strand:- start:167 stop:310 length:144 start_codon:yes stop_codon:yes gene_type:complete